MTLPSDDPSLLSILRLSHHPRSLSSFSYLGEEDLMGEVVVGNIGEALVRTYNLGFWGGG